MEYKLKYSIAIYVLNKATHYNTSHNAGQYSCPFGNAKQKAIWHISIQYLFKHFTFASEVEKIACMSHIMWQALYTSSFYNRAG